MPLQLIDDGYTLDAVVKAEGWPAVQIKYRPALAPRVQEYRDSRAAAADSAGRLKALTSLLAGQLAGWDVQTASGQPAPFNEASLRRLPDPILLKLVDIVLGYGAGPESAADEKNSGSGSASS